MRYPALASRNGRTFKGAYWRAVIFVLLAAAVGPRALAQGYKPEASVVPAARVWLVTPEEAARKRPPQRAIVMEKSDPGGPKLQIRSPGSIKVVHAPVTIDVKFVPQDGAVIDLTSLKVTYLAFIDVDITDRLAPYLSASGIHADAAELPVGDHDIEISIHDNQGRRSVEQIRFKVVE